MKFDSFIGVLLHLQHSTASQFCSYLIGYIGVHILPVRGHGNSLIFTDITLNSQRQNKILESNYNYSDLDFSSKLNFLVWNTVTNAIKCN